MCLYDGRGAGRLDDGRWTGHLGFPGKSFGALCSHGGCCGFGLRARGFFGAQRLDAQGFESRGFGGDCFLLGCMCCRRFGGCGSCGRLFLGGGLNVRGFATPANRLSGGRDWFWRRLRSWRCATTACGRLRSGLLFGAGALLTLPTRADASDLVVGEHTHVASNGNVHLPKKRHDFFGGHCEFVRQLTD